jgi:ABC-type sugar transport system ATPase subunit
LKGSCVAGVRPEHFHDATAEGLVAVPFVVELVEPLGSETYLSGSAGEGKGSHVVARVGPHTAAKAGQKVPLYMDATNLHLFAPGDNGAAL